MNSPSVDPKEVEYYRKLADQWWDSGGKFWPLHRLNHLRIIFLENEICRHFGRNPDSDLPLKGLTAVDIGCGGGILSESMAKLGARVHGIDVVDKSIRIASEHALRSNLEIEYDFTTAESLATKKCKYDIVLNMEVVEHVADLEGFVASCCELVAESGIMFIATINRNILSWFIAILGAECILRWLPRGTHNWHQFVTPAELELLLNRHAMMRDKSTGVRINPLTREFALTPRLSVNYMLSATRNNED